MIYVFIALFLVWQSLEVLGTANVGTVLFTVADLNNDTWTKENVALLRARQYFQYLLPPIITPQTPDYVETLLNYFKNVYLTISKESPDLKTDKILTLAFTDVVGGYMKMFALPIAKYAYYGGTLPTKDALRLFLFYEDLKNYLGKDGSTWSAPDYAQLDAVTINVALPQMSLVRSMVKQDQDPCFYVSYFEKTGQGLNLPTPKIDWATRTMFVPLANQSLVDLRSTNMSDALLKFYHAASNCLLSTRPNKLDNFNHRFQLWLQDDVMPHLNDDRLYAPLQGVLSLLNNTYEAESYQNLIQNYDSEDVPSSYGGCSKKIKIIIAIVLFEIFFCVPTVVYVFFRKKKDESNDSSSSVNMFFETRTNRSSSDFDLRVSKSNLVKRYGGLKLQQKPLQMMEAGEVLSRSHHSMGTDMNSCPVLDNQDRATMVDEYRDYSRRKSYRDVQTVTRVTSSANAGTGAPVKNETSDDTGKTMTLSSSTDPSNTTTSPSEMKTSNSKTNKSPPNTKTSPAKMTSGIKLRQAKNNGFSLTVIKSTASPQRRASLKHSKIDPKLEYKRKNNKELEKPTNLSDVKTSDYLKSQLYTDTHHHRTVSLHRLQQTSNELVPYKKSAKAANEERKGREKYKTFKIQDDDKSILIQGGINPYVEISIERPQLDVFNVDISRNEEMKFKKSGSPVTPRASRIPKRALGGYQLQVDRYKRPSGSTSTSRERKSMIPRLKRAFDDSFLKTSIGYKVDKLNVTL